MSKQNLRYKNVGAKNKIQSKNPPKLINKIEFHHRFNLISNRDVKLRKQIINQTKKIVGKQPKRFSKWLVFLLRILRLDKDI